MRLLILCVCVLGLIVDSSAQSDITTLIFVRHAEKVNDGNKDPELTAEGKDRAARLSALLASQPITAIYSTDFKRTRSTVQPLADAAQNKLSLYEPMKVAGLQELVSKHKGS